MTKEERHSIILDLLLQNDSILVTDLAEKLNVSSVTIRKDLTELENAKAPTVRNDEFGVTYSSTSNEMTDDGFASF